MQSVLSLRGRLTAIILIPLLLVAAFVGYWQLTNARQTATDVFDKSLLAAALAVANDVAISGGDALSAPTRDILADTSGGQVFYHVYAPDGVIVAGYATPPVGIPRPSSEAAGPNHFDATYLGRPVHGVRLQNRTEIDGFSGVFTTTVWQEATVREVFMRDLLMRSLLAIAGLIVSLALIVWFGVRVGLRPLTDLEAAIASRSGDELAPIQRAVPTEVRGIVETLNRLFGQVTQSMAAQSEFISNAAHQLKNPIAGVLALAEAVESAPNYDAAKERSRDLLDAARETAGLSQQLLLLERAKAISPTSEMVAFDMDAAFARWSEAFAAPTTKGVAIKFVRTGDLGQVVADETMLREALRNLIDNALIHGGERLSQVTIHSERRGDTITISVVDDGIGMTAAQRRQALKRFGATAATSRSGLGVSIVEAIAKGHGGAMVLQSEEQGLRVDLALPVGS